mgnify:CR=1 FL=1
MYNNEELIKDIEILRNNINMKKYDKLNSDLKDYGNLIYEDFGENWQNEIIHNELMKYKKELEKVQN